MTNKERAKETVHNARVKHEPFDNLNDWARASTIGYECYQAGLKEGMERAAEIAGSGYLQLGEIISISIRKAAKELK